MAYDCCSETKLLELQWKILHGIYPTGTLLQKMKIRNNDQCPFCDETETIVHFFVSCHIAQTVWQEAEKLISIKCGKKITLSDRNKLFGILSSDNFGNNLYKVINCIILVCKRTISKFKCEQNGNIKMMLKYQLSFRKLLN